MSTDNVAGSAMQTTDHLIAEYLDRLRAACATLPAGTRTELLDDIGTHLTDTVGPDADEAEVRRVLDELGTPEEIAAAAGAQTAVPAPAVPAQDGGALAYDVGTVLVLLLGGFVVPVLGWIAGVVMLWSGPRWNARQKWVGTLIWPAAIVLGGIALLAAHWTAGQLAVLVIVAAVVDLVGLILGFVYLLRTAAAARSTQRG